MEFEPDIDAHSHIWTPDLDHYPLAAGFTTADMKPPSFTAEELLAVCRPAGIGRVNLIQMSYYRFDNSYMLDMIKLYPGRFVGTAIIDPLGPDPARAMAELVPRGVRAFRIAPSFSMLPAARWLEPPGYAAMFAAAARDRLALSCLIEPDAFAEVDRMASRFPETTIIIDHLGRIGLDGSIRPGEVEALCALARHPRILVKVGAFYALGKKAPPYLDLAPLIERVIRAFGADRCMWESDCPFQIGRDTYKDSIDLIRGRLDFLTPGQKASLLRGTAERTFFGAR